MQNPVKPQLFVEPFAGGASVSLSVLYKGLAERVGLIDRDPLIAAFWQTLFFDTDWLIEQVLSTEITLQKWKDLKAKKPETTREKAFICLYLNRTSFSGILKHNAGPLGGKAQTSPYKIDCRFPRETIVKRIRQISQYRDRIAFVWNLHWRTALGRIQQMQNYGSLERNILFYLDPPFYKKADELYNYYFEQADHIKLRNYLVECEQPWILSYDSCKEVVEMYVAGGFEANDVNLIYKAQRHGRGVGKELILSNLPHMISELQLGTDTLVSAPKKLCNSPPIVSKRQKKKPSLFFGEAL